MKVFTVFITLLIYLFSFVSHNSVMAISSNKDLSNHNIIGNTNTNHHETSKTDNDSNQNCSLIVDFDQNIQYNCDSIYENLIIKISLNFINTSFYPSNKKDISYLKINSPPFLNKNIKNYSYIEFIKVIKSNI